MAAAVIQELLARTPELDPDEIDDVLIGCAMPEAEQGMNMGRVIALRSGLPDSARGEPFLLSGLGDRRRRSGFAEADRK
jgi:acetyl-CoA acyltransferase